MREVWLDVVGAEGRYEVSNLGAVRSIPHTVVRSNGRKHRVAGKTLKGSPNAAGYPTVNVGRKSQLVHRLVARAFIGSPKPDQTDVNHDNGVKADAYAGNLEWCTRRENVVHAIKFLGSRSGQPGRKRSADFSVALSARNAKEFSLSDAAGNLHTGSNLKAFCAERGLPYETLLRLRAGVIKSTTKTGWRLLPLETK